MVRHRPRDFRAVKGRRKGFAEAKRRDTHVAQIVALVVRELPHKNIEECREIALRRMKRTNFFAGQPDRLFVPLDDPVFLGELERLAGEASQPKH